MKKERMTSKDIQEEVDSLFYRLHLGIRASAALAEDNLNELEALLKNQRNPLKRDAEKPAAETNIIYPEIWGRKAAL
jgi:hypothetical protein